MKTKIDTIEKLQDWIVAQTGNYQGWASILEGFHIAHSLTGERVIVSTPRFTNSSLTEKIPSAREVPVAPGLCVIVADWTKVLEAVLEDVGANI